MLRHLVLLIVAMLPATPLPPEKGDVVNIQGRWRPKRIMIDYRQKPLLDVPATVHFEGDRMFMVRDDGTRVDYTPFKLDPARRPKAIDFKWQAPDGLFTRAGIYELKGDRLRICYVSYRPPAKLDRPTDFTVTPDAVRTLWELERAK